MPVRLSHLGIIPRVYISFSSCHLILPSSQWNTLGLTLTHHPPTLPYQHDFFLILLYLHITPFLTYLATSSKNKYENLLPNQPPKSVALQKPTMIYRRHDLQHGHNGKSHAVTTIYTNMLGWSLSTEVRMFLLILCFYCYDTCGVSN